jgi:hypothetical protein
MDDLQRHFGLGFFSGELPLFPLPGVILYPCSLLPLHIFEPRYRAMVADALAGDGCIGMATLKPGWEADYNGNPPIHEVVCLGKILESKPLADGRYDIVLCGVKRARIEAVVKDAPYRAARVELLDDRPVGGREREATRLRDRLLEIADRIPPVLYRHQNVPRALRKLDAPLGCSADLLADALLLPPARKLALLEELCPLARAQALVRAIEAELPAAVELPAFARAFPPEPSLN